MIRNGCYRIGRTLAAWGPRAACTLLFVGVAGVAGAQDAANQYAELMEDVDTYRQYNARLEELLNSQQADIADFTAQLDGLEATAAAVPPLLQEMFQDLEQFVANDLPFLTDERAKRIDTLRLQMAEEGALGEKFRRLLEAYQIEIEYGRTMDAYPGKLDDGRDAQFIHLGRVSLMYRTNDGEETGYWDANAGQWVVAPNYSRAVEEAIRMAEETVAPDLVTLPVPAPTTQESRS